MDVICHQAIAEQTHAVFGAVVSQELKVGLAVGITEEDVAAVVAALRDVVREAGDNNACSSGHMPRELASGREFSGVYALW